MIILHWFRVTEAWIGTWAWWGPSASAISLFFIPAIVLWPMTLSARFADWYGQIIFSVFSRYSLFALILLNAVYLCREVRGLEGILILVTASGTVGAALGLIAVIFVMWAEEDRSRVNQETSELGSSDPGALGAKRMLRVIRGGRKR